MIQRAVGGEGGGGEGSRDSSDNVVVAFVNHRAIISLLTQFSSTLLPCFHTFHTTRDCHDRGRGKFAAL